MMSESLVLKNSNIMAKSLQGIDFSGIYKSLENYSKMSKSLGIDASSISSIMAKSLQSIDFSGIYKSLENYNDQMLRLSEKALENRITFRKIIDQVIDNNEGRNEDIIVSTDGTLTINEISYKPSEVTDAFIALEETLTDKNFEQKIAQLFSNYSVQHPVIRWILEKIILALVIGIIIKSVTTKPSVIQNYNISIDSINPQYSINTIAKKAKPVLYEQTLTDDYKFVSIRSLKVYDNKSSAQPIQELKFGQVVTLLEKRHDWALIETFGSNGEYINGWVRKKYLK